MSQKIKLDENEYDVEKLSTQAKQTLASLNFSNNRITELNNMLALLVRAKNSYIDSLRSEVVAKKSGFNFNED